MSLHMNIKNTYINNDGTMYLVWGDKNNKKIMNLTGL